MTIARHRPAANRSALRRLGEHALIAAIYFVVGEVSELVGTQTADISAFWPPAGIGLAFALLFGIRILPALAVGAFVGNLLDPAGGFSLTVVPITTGLLVTALIDGALAALEAALGWLALARIGATPDPFRRVRHAMTFMVLSAGLASAVTAAIGTLFVGTIDRAAWESVVQFWLTWTTGDAVGILVITPLIVAWRPPLTIRSVGRWMLELAVVLFVIATISIPVQLGYPVEYLVLLPLVWASFRLGLRGTTITVFVVSIGALVLDLGGQGSFARFDLSVSTLLVQTFVGSVAILPLTLIPTLLERQEASTQRAKLQQDLLIARSIQQGLLPGEAPTCSGFDIAGWSCPADETGGDYFDWVTTADGRLVVTLGDVTGHGIGPALVTAACRAYVRAAVQADLEPGELLTRVNHLVIQDLPSERFITLAAAVVDPETGAVRLRSAGQGPLCIYRAATRVVEVRGADDLPLGILEELDFGDADTIALDEGDMLILITDGFVEWANAEGEMFGTQRLQASIVAAGGQSAADVIAALARDVRRHATGSPQADDLTAVVIKRRTAGLPAPTAGGQCTCG